jgi:hypothetical protein
MGDIFISYAREDHQATERLAEALKRLVGVVPDIPPGEIFLRSCLFAGVLW